MELRERLLEIINGIENGDVSIDQFVDEIREIVPQLSFESCTAPKDFEDYLRIFKFILNYEFDLYMVSVIYGAWFYQLYCNPNSDANLRRQISEEYRNLVDEEEMTFPEKLEPVLQTAYELNDAQFISHFIYAYLFATGCELEDIPSRDTEAGRWAKKNAAEYLDYLDNI